MLGCNLNAKAVADKLIKECDGCEGGYSLSSIQLPIIATPTVYMRPSANEIGLNLDKQAKLGHTYGVRKRPQYT